MRILSFLAFIVLLASCSGGSATSKRLSGSDSLVINFNTPGSNMIEKIMHTTESKAIKKLVNYTGGKSSEAFKCGYDGNLLFYKKGELLGDVSFNYSGEGCHHFIMEIDGKLNPTAMSNEAADFLKSLAMGKNWY